MVVAVAMGAVHDRFVFQAVGHGKLGDFCRIGAGDDGRRADQQAGFGAADDDPRFGAGGPCDQLTCLVLKFVQHDIRARGFAHRIEDLGADQRAAKPSVRAASVDDWPHSKTAINLWHACSFYRTRYGSKASRNPSPMKLIEMTASAIIVPGGIQSQGIDSRTVSD